MQRRPLLLVLGVGSVIVGFLAGACDRSPAPAPAPPVTVAAGTSTTAAPPHASGSSSGSASSGSASAGTAPALMKTARPAPPRLVAIGDLHGDLDAARRVLRLAGAIDAKDAWIGKGLVIVQTGDAVDRADDDRAILDLLERLKSDAAKAGGEVIAMSGNHEIMNASFDFRYVTPGAFKTFSDVSSKNPETATVLANLEPSTRGRAAAFAPGGPYATMVADRPIVVRVGDTMFVHGGIIPRYVTYGLDRINDEARAWLLGQQSAMPKPLSAEDGPLWSRMYSAAPGREECATLDQTLRMLGAKRMVMGHTVQRAGISPACDQKAWRIDTGMSKFFQGPIEALAIEGDTVTVLKDAH